MSESEKNMEITGKSKASNVTVSSFLNRSVTFHSPVMGFSKAYGGHTSSTFHNSIESVKGKVKKLCNLFESSKSTKVITNDSHNIKLLKSTKSMGTEHNRFPFLHTKSIRLPGTEDRIVVFMTSLRGIRRTYEDCYAVGMIFRGFRVWIDERDISMDSAYKKELQNVLGEKNVSLPQVFIKGCYVGGADVIKSMFETGELAKVLDGIPKRDPRFICESCGDVRFVPCGNCNGSRKVFDDDEGVLKRCLECNENGLIRCPDCCL